MNSKTVYIIGAGNSPLIEQAIKELEAKGLHPVIVESIEDCPIGALISANPSIIHGIIEPKHMPYTALVDDKKHKGHERPYKYHL